MKSEAADGDRKKVRVIEPRGRIDALTADQFNERLERELSDRTTHLVVDMKNVSYVSSSGLRVLTTAAKRISNHPGSIVFCALQSDVKRVFTLSGFTRIFSIFPDVETARAELETRAGSSETNSDKGETLC